MIIRLEETESTNTYALTHSGELHEWDIIIAGKQKAGKGRNGHSWESPEGGLWMSIFLRGNRSPALPLITGVAVCDSLKELGMEPCLKWPNDVLVKGRKISGILVEAIGDDIAVGIGINANFRISALSPELVEISTTILEETGKYTDLEALAVSIAEKLMTLLQSPENALERWKTCSCTLGRRVMISANDVIEGEAIDIDGSGALLLRTEKGTVRVLSGDCTHL